MINEAPLAETAPVGGRVSKPRSWRPAAAVACARLCAKELFQAIQSFQHAEVVGRRTVFNIHGNHYRLIARVNCRTKRVFVLYILTHAEYSKGDWKQ